MVKYYGRARQRIGSVNRNQPGLKRQGTIPRTGSLISMHRIHSRRVNGNTAIGCVDSNGRLTGKRLFIDKKGCVSCVANKKFLLIPKSFPSSHTAGGVGRHYPLRLR